MKKGFNILFYCYLVLSILMIYSCLNGCLSFGNGLGDLHYLIFSIVVLLIAIIIFFMKENTNKANSATVFGIVLIVIAMVILILKLTVLRGPEN